MLAPQSSACAVDGASSAPPPASGNSAARTAADAWPATACGFESASETNFSVLRNMSASPECPFDDNESRIGPMLDRPAALGYCTYGRWGNGWPRPPIAMSARRSPSKRSTLPRYRPVLFSEAQPHAEVAVAGNRSSRARWISALHSKATSGGGA
ncbi:hypothetical protein [Lysobacter gummosus]|uniref:hypothetical protein n=1 Tax=Lysobacter gummosus TaxID=262324 RepID=UPI003629E090